MTHNGPKNETCVCEAPKEKKFDLLEDGVYLFASATCPNCKIAEQLLNKAEIKYTKVLANDNANLANALGIKQAPTLVNVFDGEVEKFASVANVKKYIAAVRS